MSMRKLIFTGLMAACGAASAQESPHSVAFTVWGTSDYAFRGVSQNAEDPTVQGAVDYSHESGFYAGIWGSGVDFGDDAPKLEIDTYVGFGFPIGEAFKGDIQLVRYNYALGDNGSDFAYNELIGKLTFAGWLTGTIGYSNDVFATDETGIYYALGATHTFENGFTLFGGAGYYDLDDIYDGADSYTDWNLGVSQDFGPVNLSLSYVDTNSDGEVLFGDIADNRVILAAKIGF
jgi:uncharacterized protein (TIGR02001 family)